MLGAIQRHNSAIQSKFSLLILQGALLYFLWILLLYWLQDYKLNYFWITINSVCLLATLFLGFFITFSVKVMDTILFAIFIFITTQNCLDLLSNPQSAYLPYLHIYIISLSFIILNEKSHLYIYATACLIFNVYYLFTYTENHSTLLISLAAIPAGLFLSLKRLNFKNQVVESFRFSDLLLSNIHEGVIIFNTLGEPISFNQSARLMLDLGKTLDLAKLQRHFNAVQFLDLKQNPVARTELPHHRVLSTSQSQLGQTLLFKLPSQEVHYVIANAIPKINEATGQTEAVILSFRKMNQFYEQQQTIVMQQEQISQNSKLSSIGEMASGIAHEINNPLTILLGRTQQVERLITAETKFSDNSVNLLKQCEKTIYRISRIVKGMKMISRDSNNDPFQKLNVDQLIEDVVYLYKDKLNFAGITISCDLSHETKSMGRPGPISQVIVNLLQNSVEAIENQVTKWIEIKSEVQTKNGKLFLMVSFKDSGNGIDELTQKKMMNPFFTTKEIGKGTGLGLSISQGIAAQHGGNLEYNSGGSNTEFILAIPAFREE